MKRVIPFIFFFYPLIVATGVVQSAEYVLIVNKDNPISSLTRSEVKKIFLGKKNYWPDGQRIDVLLLKNSDVHHDFVYEVLNKSPRQLSMYWKQVLFSGAGIPPKTFTDPESLKALVASDPKAIGYIDIRLLDESVKKLNLN